MAADSFSMTNPSARAMYMASHAVLSPTHRKVPWISEATSLGMPLARGIREALEELLGADFSRVRVHEDPEVFALYTVAFACGEELYFVPGGYDPATPEGLFVLAHELQHVIQQRRMAPQMRSGFRAIVLEDPVLEAEANRAGMHAVRSLAGIDFPDCDSCEADAAAKSAPAHKLLPAIVQPLRVGKIPRAVFLNNNVPPEADYGNLVGSFPTVRHDVGDFTAVMRTRIVNANAAYYDPLNNPAVPMVPNALPLAGGDYASDEDQTQLWPVNQLTQWILEIDHIVPYTDWGCNDFRNARLLSKQQNNPNAVVTRPHRFLVVSMDNLANVNNSGVTVNRGQILNTAQLNTLLQTARIRYNNGQQLYRPDHYAGNPLAHSYEMTDDDFEALYYGLDQE